MRVALVGGTLLTASACAGPLLTPTPSEMPGLQARYERSRADTEGVLRLAAGHWARGDRTLAQVVTTDAYAAVPEGLALGAALGFMAEAQGQYMVARDHYIDHLGRSAGSPVAARALERLVAIRGLTAAPLVRRLTERRGRLQHGQDPQNVVALPRVGVPAGDPELEDLGAAATELLVRDLRRRGFHVLDWELVQAVRDTHEGGLLPREAAREFYARLAARRTALTNLGRTSDGSLVLTVDVVLIADDDAEVASTETFEFAPGSFAESSSAFSLLVWEMLLGAAVGSTTSPVSPPPLLTEAGARGLGSAIRAASDGDYTAALRVLSDVQGTDAESAVVAELRGEYASLIAVRDSESIPFGDELLNLVRRTTDVDFLVREAGTPGGGGGYRRGIGEVYGLDRLGSQSFTEIVFRVGQR